MSEEPKRPNHGMLEEDDEATTQHRCVGCKALSPPVRTAHTLIGKAHGWRVTRIDRGADGWEMEWRCPPCWAAYRKLHPSGASDGDD